jgi:hypothetical protein
MRADLCLFRGAALEDDRLTRADLMVLWHIGRHADFKTGWAHPSLQTLVKATGRTKRTVLKAITRLTDTGYLICRHTTRDDGTSGPNNYFVKLDPADARAEPRDPIEYPAEQPSPGGVPQYTPAENDGVPAPNEVYTVVVSDSPEKVYQAGIHLPSAVSTRNTHLTPIRTPSVEKTPGGWSGEFFEMFRQAKMFYNPGRVGRVLKAPVEATGIERSREVVAAFIRFAPHMGRDGTPHPDINTPEFCTPERLAHTWGFWLDYTAPLASLVRA